MGLNDKIVVQLILSHFNPKKGPRILISFPRNVSDEVKNPVLVNLTRYNESNYILDEIDEKPAAHVLFYLASSINPGSDEKVLLSVILERKIIPNSFIQILYDLAVKINAQSGLEKGLYYFESEQNLVSLIKSVITSKLLKILTSN